MQGRASESRREDVRLAKPTADAGTDLPITTEQALLLAAPTDIILDEPSCCSLEGAGDVTAGDDGCCAKPDIVDEVLEAIDRSEADQETSYHEVPAGWSGFAAASFLTLGALTLHTKSTKTRRRSTRERFELEEVTVN
jgi:hypothetical protein